MLGHFFEIKYHPPPCPIHRLFSFFPFKNQSQYISLIVSHHSFSVILPDSILPDTSYPHCSFKSRFPIVALCNGRRRESSPKRRCSPIFSCLPITSHPLSRSIHVFPPTGCCDPSTLPPSPRNTTQRHRGEPVPDPAACHHHKHHGQRSPQEHLLSQLQRPCRRQQIVGPCGPGCGDRREPLRWRLQLHPAHLPFSKCDQHLGVTVNGHTRKLLPSRSPLCVGFSAQKVVEFGVLRVGNGLIIYKMPAAHLIRLSAIQLQTRETKESPAQKETKGLSFF